MVLQEPADPSDTFVAHLLTYDKKLLALLSERRYTLSVRGEENGPIPPMLNDAALAALADDRRRAFWKPWTWRAGCANRRDAELGKLLQRLYALSDELLRMHCLAVPEGLERAGQRGLSSGARMRVLNILADDPGSLGLDSALEVFDALDRLAIEIGDCRHICAEVEGELYLSTRETTWLKWKDLFPCCPEPAALAKYRRGEAPSDQELDAARSMLASLRRVRSDDYQVHRARERMRARNLQVLSLLLLPVVVAFGWLIVVAGDVQRSQVALVAVSGGLGAITAGTFKARDRLIRGSDLRAFRSGIVTQLLIGGGSALFLLLVLESELVTFGADEGWAAQAVAGFVAGFSEPFLLRTVERVATLGVDEPKAMVNSMK